MIVGQAPGIREPKVGKGFAWTAGKRLFQWLAEIGLSEEKVRANGYMTAVMKCYPGKHASGHGDLKPSRQQLDNCQPHLANELRIVRPKVVLAVGGLAIERLLGPLMLERAVGREFERDLLAVHRTKAICLPHPSGASTWFHPPAHKRLIRRSLSLLHGALFEEKLLARYLA